MKCANVGVVILSVIFGLMGCKSPESLTESKTPALTNLYADSPLSAIFDSSEVFTNNFTGFTLFDPETDEFLYGVNEDKYFTPASNTKLFTFYAGLTSLPDTLAALDYVIRGDSLIFWGTGDPTFLHPDFDNDVVFDFLKNRPEKLYYSDSHFDDDLLGPGWAWGDYQYYYSTEKSPFPMYGNVVRFEIEEIETRRIKPSKEGLSIQPVVFQSRIETKSDTGDVPFLFRAFNDNNFEYKQESDTITYTTDRPFHYSPELITEMLSDTLGRQVEYINMKKPEAAGRLYGSPADTVYKRMLQPSDNFLAEQLLFVTASEFDKRMNSRAVISHLTDEILADLPDEPRWVDGSGLSRYNLFTPRSISRLLEKIDDEIESDEQLFNFFPAGGKSGTIRNWYGHREKGEPYVFAKTGTLSNNHCLSGYLLTKHGKKLIFTFMNNHYITPTNVVRREMEKVLWYIHESY